MNIFLIMCLLLLSACSKIKPGSCLVGYKESKPYIFKVISNKPSCVLQCKTSIYVRKEKFECNKNEIFELPMSCEKAVAETEKELNESDGWSSNKGYKIADCGL